MCVDTDPARRLASAEALASRLRTLDDRRVTRQAEDQERRHEELVRSNQQLVRQRQRWAALVLAFALLALYGFWSRRELAREVDRLRSEIDELRGR